MTTIDTGNARSQLANVNQDATPMVVAMRDIAAMEKAFAMVLPSGVSPERMVRVLQTTIRQNPDLADPRMRQSLLGAAMTCAQLGLDTTAAIGHAYILPFKGAATFVLGYKGAVFLAAQSGVHIKAHAIHENDTYDVLLGTEGRIVHKLPRFDVDRGKAIAYYAVATFADGTPPMFDVMSLGEIERIRLASPGKNSPAWRGHYDEMAKKTVLKRLSKSLPIGPRMSEAVASDEAPRVDVSPDALDVIPAAHIDVPDEDEVAEGEIVDEFDPETGEVIPPGASR